MALSDCIDSRILHADLLESILLLSENIVTRLFVDHKPGKEDTQGMSQQSSPVGRSARVNYRDSFNATSEGDLPLPVGGHRLDSTSKTGNLAVEHSDLV